MKDSEYYEDQDLSGQGEEAEDTQEFCPVCGYETYFESGVCCVCGND